MWPEVQYRVVKDMKNRDAKKPPVQVKKEEKGK
jgi:hypothetical protein